MKIAFFETETWQADYLKGKLAEAELSFFAEPLSEKNIDSVKDCEIISPFIYSEMNKDILHKLPNLKMIATMSTGFDHIDVVTAKKDGIAVCNVPFYGENTVAEHTFALILALSRKLIDSVERARKGDFTLDGLRGFDLKGKTLGIVGFGGGLRKFGGLTKAASQLRLRRDSESASQRGSLGAGSWVCRLVGLGLGKCGLRCLACSITG